MTYANRSWFRSLDRECQVTRQAISAELDGEVSEIEAAAAGRHRAASPGGERFAGWVARTTGAVRSAPQLVPSRRLVAGRRRFAVRGMYAAGFAAARGGGGVLGAGG